VTKRKVLAAQDVGRMCAVCGVENPSSLGARFFELDDGRLLGVFTPREEHQGYPGRLHGGIATALLDETMGRAIAIRDPGAWGVTVELTVRFRKPVPLDAEVRAIGRITNDFGRKYEAAAEIVLEGGVVAVEATGTFLRMPLHKIAEGNVGREIIADERERPVEVEV
jgi:uncharacterized protein (TIGR00369 family)